MITALIVTGAVLLACAAAGYATWRIFFRDGGGHAAPRPRTRVERIGELPGVRAFRSAPPHPRAMFGPGIDGPSVPLHQQPAERH